MTKHQETMIAVALKKAQRANYRWMVAYWNDNAKCTSALWRKAEALWRKAEALRAANP